MKRKVEERKEARRLRKEEGLSVNAIADKLSVSKGSVSYWIRNIELTEEQKRRLIKNTGLGSVYASEALKNKYKKFRMEWQQEGRKKAKDREWLHVAGCMLYWGEGRKKRNVCSIGNTDPNVLKFFLKFIRTYFDVPDEKIALRIYVHLNNGKSIDDVGNYWTRTLGLPNNSLRSVSSVKVRDGNKSGSKRNTHIYGVCEISIGRTDIVQHIFGAIQEIAGFECGEWLNKV